MLPITVNANCEIIEGSLKGFKGKVVAFDYPKNEVTILLDKDTYVITKHENIKQ